MTRLSRVQKCRDFCVTCERYAELLGGAEKQKSAESSDALLFHFKLAEGQYFELCVKKYTRMLAQEMGGGE